MSTLADALEFEPPADFIRRLQPITSNYSYIKLLYNGVGSNSRHSYNTAIRSYEAFCRSSAVLPWPATRASLAPWIVTRTYGLTGSATLGQLAGNSISDYVSGLRSVHVDLDLPITIFECPHIRRLIAGASTLFPKRPSLPKLVVTRSLLLRLLSPEAYMGESDADRLTLNAAFALAFSGFLRMGEFTWSTKEVQSTRTFAATRPTRRCITMEDGHMEFFLPRSKTDVKKEGITILLAAAGDAACPVSNMQILLSSLAGSPDSPLFSLNEGTFTRARVLKRLDRRLANIGIPPGSLTGHSFRKGAAQHAHEMQVPKGEVQYMGRWASEAIERYYKRSRSHQIAMQRKFQTGQAVALL